MQRQTGEYERSTVTGEEVAAFIPFPLPPRDPPLKLHGDLAQLLDRASEQLRLLDLAGDLVPSVVWFVYAFVRKEAVLSAQIEGTQTTLMDLLEVEASGEASVDANVEEVCGYLDALNFTWDELGRDTGVPISMRLLSEAHRRLLAGARGLASCSANSSTPFTTRATCRQSSGVVFCTCSSRPCTPIWTATVAWAAC